MKLIDLTNKRFSRLLVLKRIKNKWLCKCDCGIEKLVSSENLKNGTKSCGCYNKDRIKNISPNFNSRKYSPEIASARRAWKNKYSDGDLTFEDFYNFSKQNCYYCNSYPNQVFNYFTEKYSAKSKEQGNFIYNGLDRINSNLPHNKNNIVTSCYTCNRFKSNLSIEDFYNWISKIKEKQFKQHEQKEINLNSYQLSNLRKIWSDSYNKEIDFNFFISISQENCFYCDTPPSNYSHYQYSNKYSEKARKFGMIKYSGLDRFTNKEIHQIDDVVPCCKHCNFAKSNMIPKDFFNHIYKINENKQTNNIVSK